MKKEKVIRSAGVVGGFTMMSRLLGLARDVLMAGAFGTSLAASSFFVAFTIPNLFRRLFGEGALSAAFIPVFVESRKREGDEAAWGLARKIITLAAITTTLIAVVGVALVTVLMAHPDWVVRFSEALGKPELAERVALILPLLRIMLPYMVFICLVALSMGILNSFHHFALPAATPVLLNLVWIVALIAVCPRLGASPSQQIYGVAWAIVLAGVIQLAAQFPALKKYGYRPGLALGRGDERVGRVVRLMGPAALGLAVTQFNVVIDRLLAAWVSEAAPSALFYSERLIYLPLGIFATALGTVLLPVLSGHASDGAGSRAHETINHSLRLLLFVMVPASLGLLVLASPIVQMIFEWRNFGAADTAYTKIALQYYAPGLVVFSLAKVFVPTFYARQDTRTPVKVGVAAMLLNLVLNITFVLTWPQHLKHAGLACATVISEGVFAVVLAVLIHRSVGSPRWREVLTSAGRTLVAATAMAVVVGYGHAPLFTLAGWLGGTGKVAQVGAVAATVVLGVAVYVGASRLLRSPELGEITKALGRRTRS